VATASANACSVLKNFDLEEEIETWEIQDMKRKYDIHPDDIVRYNELMEEIRSLLTENEAITGFAKAPEVELNLVDRTPKWLHQYPIPEANKEAVRAQIKRWLDKGKIRVSKSLWNLPLTTALKKDQDGNITGVRVCLDPRAINQRIIPDNFTIPNIREIHASFHGMKYFSEFDLEDAFLQLKLREIDQEPLSFTWEGVQYSFVGAPYGVKIMSNVFQRTVGALFADMPFVKVYIDNIVVASRSWAEHRQHVKQVLIRLNELNLKISMRKLKLARRFIRILGKEISAEGSRAEQIDLI